MDWEFTANPRGIPVCPCMAHGALPAGAPPCHSNARRATRYFPVYCARATRLYWNGLSLTTARRVGVLHCETEPLHDKCCPAS
ncbi:hypothetical protein BN2475_220046 [Paraburkholderia ribeironis]|uniref:Uncharacterized protein n=1 Tax=Paraburkholderia ribeironis TaxID=1247936 RepID=A0A1N7RXD9_9BURK|nr:hypothetical protein BN2475_220046 [Paraburkholderia ribeironis]